MNNINELDNLELLDKYKKLLDKGIITKEEFKVKKEEIFNNMPERNITVNEKWLWALATVPIALSIIGNNCWIYFTTSKNSFDIFMTILMIILNIIFLTLDTKEIKKVGKDAEGWMFLGFILVPIYIFIRESKTNKNYIPGVTWIILFIISLL